MCGSESECDRVRAIVNECERERVRVRERVSRVSARVIVRERESGRAGECEFERECESGSERVERV